MKLRGVFLKIWLLFGFLSSNLDLAYGQGILFSPVLQKAYPKIEIKRGHTEVWIRNVWFREVNSGFEFCTPGTKDSYLVVFSFMPERGKPKPVLIESKAQEIFEWDSLFKWVSRKVNGYYNDNKFHSHSDILKYSSFKFFLEEEKKILENKGLSFLEIYRYLPGKRTAFKKPDLLTLNQDKPVYPTKDSFRIWYSYKTNLKELSDRLPLNQLINGGPGILKNSLSFWVINSLEFEDVFEKVNGKVLGKD